MNSFSLAVLFWHTWHRQVGFGRHVLIAALVVDADGVWSVVNNGFGFRVNTRRAYLALCTKHQATCTSQTLCGKNVVVPYL